MRDKEQFSERSVVEESVSEGNEKYFAFFTAIHFISSISCGSVAGDLRFW